MKKYYRFETCTDGLDMPHDFRETLYYRSINLNCAHIRPEVAQKKFTIPVKELDLSCAYNFINGSLATNIFFRNDLFSILKPYLIHEFDFGQIKYQNQVVSDGYVLWEKTEGIYLRSGPKACCWRCPYCGRLIYSRDYYGHIRPYVMQQDIDGAKIRHTRCDGLVIDEEVYQVLISYPDWKKLKYKIALNGIKVLKEPKDGFPFDLNTIRPEDERRLPS